MLFLELIAQVFTRRTIALDADFYKYTGEGKGGDGRGGQGRGMGRREENGKKKRREKKTAAQRYPFLTRAMERPKCVKLDGIAARRGACGFDSSIIEPDKWSDRRKSYFRYRYGPDPGATTNGTVVAGRGRGKGGGVR